MGVGIRGHSAHLLRVGCELAHLLGGSRDGRRAWNYRHDGRTIDMNFSRLTIGKNGFRKGTEAAFDDQALHGFR